MSDDSHNESKVPNVEIIEKKDEKRIDVEMGGELFTSYIYPEDIAKPVLYPLVTKTGKVLTRGFPLMPKEGERVDHPHHVGLWFNYGDVNGLDFWNNSEAIPEEKKEHYGTIVHTGIEEVKDNQFTATMEWRAPDGTVLLDENTIFRFSENEKGRYIDRITTLKTRDEEVSFNDNKEGMIGVRVTRALELPSDSPAIFTDAQGNPTTVEKLDNSKVKGDYLSSEGITGGEVWGTRADWMQLHSEIEGDPVSITIMDHPDNVGYPTFWHARGYGLFAANPLGQKVFSDGDMELNFKMNPQESVTFKHRIIIHSGSKLGEDDINLIYKEFTGK